jgi:hypothetical protein
MGKYFVELCRKGGSKAYLDGSQIKAIYSSPGIEATTIAPPDQPFTVVLIDGTEVVCFGISVCQLLESLKAYGRIDGWLPLMM